MSDYHNSKRIKIEKEIIMFAEERNFEKTTIKCDICPECSEHGHVQQAAHHAYDCKNLFYVWIDEQMKEIPEFRLGAKQKVVGQCCCYSFEHGVRMPTSGGHLDLLEKLISHLDERQSTMVSKRIEQFKERGY